MRWHRHGPVQHLVIICPSSPSRAQLDHCAAAQVVHIRQMVCCRDSWDGKKTCWGSCKCGSSQHNRTVTSSARYSCSCIHLDHSHQLLFVENATLVCNEWSDNCRASQALWLFSRKLCDKQTLMQPCKRGLAGQHLHQGNMPQCWCRCGR